MNRSLPTLSDGMHVALPCAVAGGILLVLGFVRTFALAQGDVGAHIAVLAALLTLAALSIFLLCRAGLPAPEVLTALLFLGLAFYLRVFSLDHITFDYQDFLSKWALFFRENGGFSAIKHPVGNYNVPYLYFMAAISYLPVPDLYLIKLFSIFFDVLLAWGGLRMVRVLCPLGPRRQLAAFCLLLLLPTVLLNGAFWGQCDALYGALALHALACALDHRPKTSVVLLAIAFSFKLQTVFLLPLWCILWYSKRVKFSHLCLFPLTYLGTILPALLLGKPLGDILGVYLGQASEYQNLTLNAPSLYALIPYNTQVHTESAAMLGILAAFLLVFALLGVLFFLRERINDQAIFTAAVLLSVGVPLLLPHMHDRYFFLADTLTLVWACTNFRRIPQAVAVQIASLGAYHAYLVLRYAFPMSWGALLLLAVLLSTIPVLRGQLALVCSVHAVEGKRKKRKK